MSRHADVFYKMFLLVQGEGGIVKTAPYIYNNVEQVIYDDIKESRFSYELEYMRPGVKIRPELYILYYML